MTANNPSETKLTRPKNSKFKNLNPKKTHGSQEPRKASINTKLSHQFKSRPKVCKNAKEMLRKRNIQTRQAGRTRN